MATLSNQVRQELRHIISNRINKRMSDIKRKNEEAYQAIIDKHIKDFADNNGFTEHLDEAMRLNEELETLRNEVRQIERKIRRVESSIGDNNEEFLEDAKDKGLKLGRYYQRDYKLVFDKLRELSQDEIEASMLADENLSEIPKLRKELEYLSQNILVATTISQAKELMAAVDSLLGDERTELGESAQNIEAVPNNSITVSKDE